VCWWVTSDSREPAPGFGDGRGPVRPPVIMTRHVVTIEINDNRLARCPAADLALNWHAVSSIARSPRGQALDHVGEVSLGAGDILLRATKPGLQFRKPAAQVRLTVFVGRFADVGAAPDPDRHQALGFKQPNGRLGGVDRHTVLGGQLPVRRQARSRWVLGASLDLGAKKRCKSLARELLIGRRHGVRLPTVLRRDLTSGEHWPTVSIQSYCLKTIDQRPFRRCDGYSAPRPTRPGRGGGVFRLSVWRDISVTVACDAPDCACQVTSSALHGMAGRRGDR
jgi:hypothetical protein